MLPLKTKAGVNLKVLTILKDPKTGKVIFVCIDIKTFKPVEVSMDEVEWVGR